MSMTTKSLIVLVASFVLIALFHTNSCAWQGKIVGMIDADLFLVSDGTRTDKVKLYGVECPKRGQPYWELSKTLASHLALNKTAEITPVSKGYEGFDNALIRVEGSKDYLNVQMISHGLAWVRPNECSANICAEWRGIENLARSKAIGLWLDPAPVPPWEWAREQRLKIGGQQKEKAAE